MSTLSRCSMLAICCVASVPELALPGESWVGERVMFRKPVDEIKFGDRDASGKQVYFDIKFIAYKVVKEEDGWLRIHAPGQQGWVDKADCVRVADAPGFYTRFIRKDAEDAWAWFQRAGAWSERKEYENAVKDYTEYLRLVPDDEMAFNNRGLARGNLKDYDQAIRDFTESIRLKPTSAFPFNGRGWCHLAKEDFAKAISDLNEATRLDPEDVNAMNNRGIAWHLQGEYARAIREYDAAARLDARFVYPPANKAYLLATCAEERIRNGKEALALAKKACELAKFDDGWALSALAAAHAELGEFAEAVKWERKAQAHPDYASDAIHERMVKNAPARLKSYEGKKAWRETIKATTN